MNKLNISIIITLITLIFGAGGSIAVVKNKTDKIDRIEEKQITDSERLAKAEIVIANIDKVLDENKEQVKEIKSDIKLMLKEILKQ